MWHILLHSWRLERFRGCVFRCELARYDRDTNATELAPTLIQHLADRSQSINNKTLSPCRVMAACNANPETNSYEQDTMGPPHDGVRVPHQWQRY